MAYKGAFNFLCDVDTKNVVKRLKVRLFVLNALRLLQLMAVESRYAELAVDATKAVAIVGL